MPRFSLSIARTSVYITLFAIGMKLSLRLVRGDLLKQLQPSRVDLARRDGFAQRAARFMRMVAVVEAALAEILREFDKALFDAAEAQVMQAECLHAGAVDQAAGSVQPVQARMGGGVLAGIQRAGNLARGGLRIRQQRVDQGGFAHAGLADQHAGVACRNGRSCDTSCFALSSSTR